MRRAATARLSREGQAAVVLGAALMTLGAFCPWATAVAHDTSVPVVVSGFGHGAHVVLVAAALLLTATWARRKAAVVVVALPAVAFVAFVAHDLPEKLLRAWAWQASDSVGIGLALLGGVVALAGGLRR